MRSYSSAGYQIAEDIYLNQNPDGTIFYLWEDLDTDLTFLSHA